ncbi:MAG: VOC family protein [Thaumarchaeota archaeon]|nr:VOC family protein [Nitrososphaerota archaeon]
MTNLITIRYLVNEVSEAVAFYTSNLDFQVKRQFGEQLAIMERDGVMLMLTGPKASGSWAMPDGTKPSPGASWNRFIIYVDDIESQVSRLKKNGVKFRNEILDGTGGKQILLLDPSGNIVELYEADPKFRDMY